MRYNSIRPGREWLDPNASPYGGTIVNSYCHAWSCAPAYFLREYFPPH